MSHKLRPDKGPAVLAILSSAFTLCILFYKRPDAFLNAQFWAEECTVFFSEAYHEGASSLFNTCLGYFHLYPRLVFYAGIKIGFPLQWMPFLNCYAWLMILILLFVYIWKRVELEPWRKFFLTLIIPLIPIQSEILMNLTNVQWIMALFPVVIFSATDLDRNKKWFYADVLLLFITGLTGPHMLVIMPLLLVWLYKKKRRPGRETLLVYLAILQGICVMAALVLFGNISRREGEFAFHNVGFINYLYKQFAMLFIGKFAFDTPLVLQYIVVAGLLPYAIYLSYKILKENSMHALAATSFFTGMLFVTATLVSYRNDPGVLHPHYGAARNFFLPADCFRWYIITNIKMAKPSYWLTLLVTILFLENLRSIKPETLIDYNWPYYAKKIRQSDTLTIPINPRGWHISIDNSRRR